MNRREFIAASAAAAVTPMLPTTPSAEPMKLVMGNQSRDAVTELEIDWHALILAPDGRLRLIPVEKCP